MSREHGQKFSSEFCESDRQVRVGDGLDSPIATTDNESGLLSERSARVNVPPTRTRKHATKFCYGTAAQKCIDSAQEPNRKNQPAISQVARYLTRCPEDASADCVSDTNSKAKANAQYAEQVAAATAWAESKEATQGVSRFISRGRLRKDFLSGGHWGGSIAREVRIGSTLDSLRLRKKPRQCSWSDPCRNMRIILVLPRDTELS